MSSEEKGQQKQNKEVEVSENRKDSDIENISDYIPDISDGVYEQFLTYFEILKQFNTRINLVSNSTLSIAGRRHFADSYHGIKSFDEEIPSGSNIYDFGSGNGFPGLVFAIMRPDLNFHLVERDRRKSEFLKHTAHSLELKNVETFHGETRDLKRGSVQFAISRAMAPMPKMLLETRDVMAQDGHLFLFKGEYWTGEFANIPALLFDLWDISVKGSYQIGKGDIIKFTIDCHRVDS